MCSSDLFSLSIFLTGLVAEELFTLLSIPLSLPLSTPPFSFSFSFSLKSFCGFFFTADDEKIPPKSLLLFLLDAEDVDDVNCSVSE